MQTIVQTCLHLVTADSYGVFLEVIEDVESISDIFRLKNGSFNKKVATFLLLGDSKLQFSLS